MIGTQVQSRDYQQRVISNVLKAIEQGHKSVLIEAPTGSGKTIIAHLLAAELIRRFGYTVGWTSMRRHLIHQATLENQAKFQLAIQYFSTFTDKPPQVDMLIIDEAQHEAAATSTQVIKTINPKILIGLTATPYRTDRLKLCFSKVVKDAGLRQLIDAGWLSPFHHYSFNADWTPEHVADIYLRDRAKWGKTIGFFLTELECDRCADLIRQGGAKCEVVTGSSRQEEQIDGFMYDDTDILLNMVVLTEGLDCPMLRTVFIRPGSKAPTIQMGGRAFRRWMENPEAKPHCNVVQNNQTHWPFTKIASAEARYLMDDGEWVQRDRNEKADVAQATVIMAIARIDTQMPDIIRRKMQKKRRRRVSGRAIDTE